ncbi:MAG: alpha/beta hydrolase [Haloechinothrix sp.]
MPVGVRVRRAGSRRTLILGTLVPLLLAGCTVGPSTRPAVLENDGPSPSESPAPTQQAPLPPLGETENSAVDWAGCDAETRVRLGKPAVPRALRFSCAKISNTVDSPSLPERGTVRLSLLKVGTGKVPLVVVNDIGGAPGTLYAARLAATLPAEFLDRFSLIGVDRRYTGTSQQNACIPPEVREQLVGLDPAAADVEPLLDAARKAGQQCSIELGNDQGALDAWHSAGDLEQIRIQLGMSRLHAIARGEGSRVLTIYAGRFTNHVGRVVLDGMPDPAGNALTVWKGVAAGAESTLDEFAENCARRDCPLGKDARKTVDALVDQLRAEQATTPKGGRMGPSHALYAIWTGLAQRDRWPELATAIDEARDGKVDKLAAFTRPMLHATAAGQARLDSTLATRCNDTVTRLTPDRINTVTEEWRRQHPVFGGLVAQQLVWCEPWPVRREPLPDLDVPGAPPIMLISTADDPVTPEIGTIRAGNQMSTAVTVAWEGAGHGAVGHSSCVGEKVQAFLMAGKVPQRGTRCPA